jgi:hypothetical protein
VSHWFWLTVSVSAKDLIGILIGNALNLLYWHLHHIKSSWLTMNMWWLSIYLHNFQVLLVSFCSYKYICLLLPWVKFAPKCLFFLMLL